MSVNFIPGYYKVTKLIKPNVIEVDDTWFIRLEGVGEDLKTNELNKWLKIGNSIRVVPYERSNDARIISDVWLGRVHINRQFSNYKKKQDKDD